MNILNNVLHNYGYWLFKVAQDYRFWLVVIGIIAIYLMVKVFKKMIGILISVLLTAIAFVRLIWVAKDLL